MEKYVAFLRGINVGGHHKVPMKDLKVVFEDTGFKSVVTILNSGNILFEADQMPNESKISERLSAAFGFSIPVWVRTLKALETYSKSKPFEQVTNSNDTRLYVSFLRKKQNESLSLPWKSEDGSFIILQQIENCLFSVLDLSKSKTTKAMEIIEKFYQKDVTTRNWKTIQRIMKKASQKK